MKKENRLIKAYGENEYGFAYLPQKISGTKVSRVLFGDDVGCSVCFPHGYETNTWRGFKNQRCWKKQRKNQWK